jgi:asparagine synthetase B (glutamine-hydrolysing)
MLGIKNYVYSETDLKFLFNSSKDVVLNFIEEEALKIDSENGKPIDIIRVIHKLRKLSTLKIQKNGDHTETIVGLFE